MGADGEPALCFEGFPGGWGNTVVEFFLKVACHDEAASVGQREFCDDVFGCAVVCDGEVAV